MHTLLLLPGLACDAEHFRDQLPALRARHRVHVSDAHFRFDTLPQMAAALLAEHAGALVCIGSSMGGMLALEMHHQAPQRLAGMALLGSTARPDTPELIKLRSEAITLFEAGRMDEVLRANVLFAFHPEAAGNAALIEAYVAMIQRAGAPALVRQNRAVMARRDMRAALAGITCPLLVACGDSDALTPPACSQEIAAAAAHAQLHILQRCGHMLTWERPAQLNTLLLEWLLTLE
jgi:pimeloyl-ACP methyl ester carboxylesterase